MPIEWLNRVESIRRVLIAAPPGDTHRIADLRRRLACHDLTYHDKVVGVLNPIASGDWVVRQYTRVSREWSTVTPVVLPGHDDHEPRKAEGLLRKALVQSGVELAGRYERAGLPGGPMYHVQVRFGQDVSGPLAVGAGRYRGFGVMAAEGDAG